MNAIELTGEIDDRHELRARVPEDLPVGQVRVIILLPSEDAAGALWATAIARDWSADLGDPRQDLYTLDDGQAVNARG